MTFLFIVVEGIIGAGKSYIMEQLQRYHPDWDVVFEPVSAWQDVTKDCANNLLEKYYKNTSR